MSDQTPETENAEHQKLIELLKFTPRTYTMRVWGYGGDYAMGTVDRKIYDYFKNRRLDFAEFCYNDSYAEENNIPEEMWPFPPDQWYECDNLIHVNGVDMNGGTIEIEDEEGNIVYRKDMSDISEDDITTDGGDEAFIHQHVTKDKVVFYGVSSEKGTFFETEIELKAPFELEKLNITFCDVDGNEIMSGAQYDGEELDNMDMNTNGKGYDMTLYALKSGFSGGYIYQPDSIESYTNVDSITYPTTDWFPKKINPVRTGMYEVMTAGRSSYLRNAEWTGEYWKSNWGDEVLKIKSWRGASVDPDSVEFKYEEN